MDKEEQVKQEVDSDELKFILTARSDSGVRHRRTKYANCGRSR